jgi:dihydroorotase
LNSTENPGPLTISAGRVVCPKSGFDGPGTIVIQDGRISSVDSSSTSGLEPGTTSDLDYPNGVLLPGLIDLHAHPAKSGSVFGADPDTTMLARGTAAVLSQGDAGADNIDEFLTATVEASRTRVLLALNLSRIGESTSEGCFDNLADADIDACVAATARHSDLVRMLAVNVSHHACGETDPREILRRGLIAAEQSGLPLLFGMRCPEDWPLAEQLALLRPGDVVTYCFRREPHCIVDLETGKVLPCVLEARSRGVLFDIGHGMASFSFEVAEAAIADGFLPDTISTDLQNRHEGQTPQHDLPLVMSKLAAAGMSEPDIFRAVTATPATVLKLANAGSLSVGSPADLVVLEREEDVTLTDAHGECRQGTRFAPRCVVRSGQIVLP